MIGVNVVVTHSIEEYGIYVECLAHKIKSRK